MASASAPAPPAGGLTPRRALSRGRSFHQAFREAQEGIHPAVEKLGTKLPELQCGAFSQTYATRPPDEDNPPSTSVSRLASGAQGPGLSGSHSGGASGAKAFITATVSRVAAMAGVGDGAASPGQQGCGAEADEQSAEAAGVGRDGAEDLGAGSPEQGEDEEEDEDEGDDGEANDGEEDLGEGGGGPEQETVAAAAAEEFKAVASGSGGGGGGLMSQLKGVYDKGGKVDASDEGGGGAQPDPQAALKQAIKDKMDEGRGKMDSAMSGLFKRGKSRRPGPEEAGDAGEGTEGGVGGALASFLGGMKEAAQEKLEEMREAAAELTDAVGIRLPQSGPGRGGGKGGGGGKGKAAQGLHWQPHPVVHGKDPWLPSGLSPKQIEIRAATREMVTKHVLPYAATWDKTKEFSRRFFREAAKAGLCGALVPKLAGGRGWSHGEAAAAFEVVGGADLGSACLLVQQHCVAWTMGRYAPLPLRLALTRGLTKGWVLGSIAASEPQARTDAARTLSFAVEYKDMSGDYWILNGLKDLVPLCGRADLCLVAARTSPNPAGGLTFFLLPKIYPGLFPLGRAPDRVGCRPLTHGTAVLACCIVRAEMRVATERALDAIHKAVPPHRLLLASAAVGAAAVQLQAAQAWLGDDAHRHFANPLSGYQALAHRVARLGGRVEAARLVVAGAAAALDSRDPAGPAQVALAKRYAVGTALEVVEAVRTMYGAASVHTACALDRVRRGLLVLQLLGGDGEECVSLAWSKVVSKRKSRQQRRAGRKKAPGAQPGGGDGEGEEEAEGEEDEEEDDCSNEEDEEEDA
ncbi:hypothetical protein HYH03_012867 [Edaphochlamys debaryana]|uniref:Acyl-CoA dehydrogenase n=1 Tax=Edaphochlamys debaryana TaxID=47281 RepID=A0A836BV05_9CHLO|nr:hypothetical protein HYH03_012867 [Edaphochlamys debaryana]|eukprot:KAG2488548.1 hypothetical protein HYH03_012867 [Edaphochlamys debaryana]